MKNKTRRDYVKQMRFLTLISMLFLISCCLIGLFSGDIGNTGFFLVLLGFVGFGVFTALQYNMLKKCRCRKCGYVEVFKTKNFVVIDVNKRCPKCNVKLKEDEIVA